MLGNYLREEDLALTRKPCGDRIAWLSQVESDKKLCANLSETLVFGLDPSTSASHLRLQIFSPARLRHISSQELDFMPKRPYAL